jgi:benzoyl-CoA 2,3-dioxygenase component B
MLTEEAHHMFVGETGIGRVVKRTLEVMKELGTDDPAKIRAHGAVDLGLLQKYLNFWCSSSLDLFGSEISSNSAANFANGLKGRPDESSYDDHVLRETQFKLATPEGVNQVPMLNALNEVMRESYLKDCEIGLKRWNRAIERAGHKNLALTLPSSRFRRSIGAWAGQTVAPDGSLVEKDFYSRNLDNWIPSAADRAFVQSLMKRVVEPGKIAGWVAPPDRGINNLPVDYEYVKLS